VSESTPARGRVSAVIHPVEVWHHPRASDVARCRVCRRRMPDFYTLRGGSLYFEPVPLRLEDLELTPPSSDRVEIGFAAGVECDGRHVRKWAGVIVERVPGALKFRELPPIR